MACRVSEPLSMQWCCDPRDSRNYLHNHKMKFCMHKNDLVLNCGQSLNNCATVMFNCKAYPSVVSNLGEMSTEARVVLKWLYHSSGTGRAFLENKRRIQSEFVPAINSDRSDTLFTKAQDFDKNRCIGELSNMPYFTAQGYSLGLAYASTLSGDNVASVLIGGMQTVMNGHFDCRAGQVIQWYFDFEQDMFHHEDRMERNDDVVSQGMRKTCPEGEQNISKLVSMVQSSHDRKETETERKRYEYNSRELGALDGIPRGGMNERKTNIALPKPYLLRCDGSDHYGDKIRVFAKCISGARKHEMMDIMLMTQSL